ncbi:unnamed protein product [Periconia digitata]|uniref:Uncharacterized protein n=1 Tax=Periconia digitata TaxID=1303443 RepID=A0A9W4XWP4_9PLEO|nr:unnamed protein product [Periconia digitata]
MYHLQSSPEISVYARIYDVYAGESNSRNTRREDRFVPAHTYTHTHLLFPLSANAHASKRFVQSVRLLVYRMRARERADGGGVAVRTVRWEGIGIANKTPIGPGSEKSIHARGVCIRKDLVAKAR